MKKYFVLFVLSLVIFNVKAELTKIDFKWTKVISFHAIALSEQDVKHGKIGKLEEEGKILIQYEHFGSAGSLCTICIDAGEKFKGTALNGSKTNLEDVIIFYDPDKGYLCVLNKLGENLFWVIPGPPEKPLNLLVFYDITPFILK